MACLVRGRGGGRGRDRVRGRDRGRGRGRGRGSGSRVDGVLRLVEGDSLRVVHGRLVGVRVGVRFRVSGRV